MIILTNLISLFNSLLFDDVLYCYDTDVLETIQLNYALNYTSGYEVDLLKRYMFYNYET